jgi:hypothetical protein
MCQTSSQVLSEQVKSLIKLLACVWEVPIFQDFGQYLVFRYHVINLQHFYLFMYLLFSFLPVPLLIALVLQYVEATGFYELIPLDLNHFPDMVYIWPTPAYLGISAVT